MAKRCCLRACPTNKYFFYFLKSLDCGRQWPIDQESEQHRLGCFFGAMYYCAGLVCYSQKKLVLQNI